MEDNIQDRIAWNSALNNAVHIVSSQFAREGIHVAPADEAVVDVIERWQLYFYKNLTERQKKAEVPNPRMAEKGRHDAESDAGLAGDV